MKLELTRRGAYAIRAALTLARADADTYLPASRIAREMDIPARFLPQVLGDLVRAGLVTARLGRSGGYRLAKPAASLSLLDIIDASEGDTRRRTCILSGKTCGDSDRPCDVHDAFFAAQSALLDRLARTSLDDVASDSSARAPLASWPAVVPASGPAAAAPASRAR